MSGTRALAAAFAAAFAASLAAEPAGPPAAVLPPLSRSADPDRAFADVPLARAAEPSAALAVAFADPVPAGAARAVSFHLRSGAGWLYAQIPPERARGTVRIPFGAFAGDGLAGPAAAADAVRVSVWRRGPASDTPPIAVSSASFAPPASVAVAGTGPGADRCVRILDRIGLAADRLPAAGFDPADLARRRVLFLPDAAATGPEDAARLAAFVRGGGRLVVFYSADPALSKALGLSPGTWEGSPKGWRAMSVSASGRRIPHETGNRICPRPGPGARTLATWVDAGGRDTVAPAVVLTPAGAWFSHTPPRAFPAACDLVRDIVDALAPGLVPPRARPTPATPPGIPADFALGAWCSAEAAAGPPPPSVGLLFADAPPDWFRANAARFGAARDGAANAAGTNAAERPPAGAHAWLPCLAARDGTWRDPADPETCRAVAEEAARLVRAGAAGVHLDYVRSAAGGGRRPARAAAITRLVRDVARAVRRANPAAAVSAAVFPTPADAAAVDQDWPEWISEGIVDFVCPMIYDDDPDAFRARLGACLAAAPAAALVPGIGTGADESQADPDAAAAELSACIGAGCRGAAFFRLDDALPEILAPLCR